MRAPEQVYEIKEIGHQAPWGKDTPGEYKERKHYHAYQQQYYGVEQP